MEPTSEQLKELYLLGREATLQLRCFIRLIDVLPGKEVCVVIQPREFPGQRVIVYIYTDGSRKYV